MDKADTDFETAIIALPDPALPRGSLQAALAARRTTREFLRDPLPLEALSALLWSAAGVNRSRSGGRTVPSAHGWREVELYAVTADGAWRYDAPDHRLLPAARGDLRAATGEQDFAAIAPLNLVFVADFLRMPGVAPEDREFLAGVSAGAMAQNAYLACAAMDLGCVVRALIDRRRLAAALNLRYEQRTLLAQTVGFPAAH
jgi:SagB-type dehydrogenase family enzyme